MYDFKQKLLKSDIDYFLKDEKLLRTKIRWAVNSIRSGQEILDKYMNELGFQNNLGELNFFADEPVE